MAEQEQKKQNKKTRQQERACCQKKGRQIPDPRALFGPQGISQLKMK